MCLHIASRNARAYLKAMSKAKKIDWNGCPTRYAAGIFGDKWCLVILRDVLLLGRRTYSDFLNAPEGISTNILANRLAKMESAGLLDRQIDPRKASRVCYFPTRKARDLLPTLISMMVWSTQYDKDSDAPPSFAEAYRTDPVATLAWYEAEVDKVDAAILRDLEG